jgi:hypothetical protein
MQPILTIKITAHERLIILAALYGIAAEYRADAETLRSDQQTDPRITNQLERQADEAVRLAIDLDGTR